MTYNTQLQREARQDAPANALLGINRPLKFAVQDDLQRRFGRTGRRPFHMAEREAERAYRAAHAREEHEIRLDLEDVIKNVSPLTAYYVTCRLEGVRCPLSKHEKEGCAAELRRALCDYAT